MASISVTASRSCASVKCAGMRISATPPTIRACTERVLRAERITRYGVELFCVCLPAMAMHCRIPQRGWMQG